jgi:DNA-nicking Smr family endonuclease
MDRRNYDRLRRGKLKPEARIDLHGMTAAQAHSRLNVFIADSQARGFRLVLVITGKGRSSGTDDFHRTGGVLRQSVPHWLHQPHISPMVLEIVQAHIRHGGEGAYYVYLRRQRG